MSSYLSAYITTCFIIMICCQKSGCYKFLFQLYKTYLIAIAIVVVILVVVVVVVIVIVVVVVVVV